jgi:hypothetical protein
MGACASSRARDPVKCCNHQRGEYIRDGQMRPIHWDRRRALITEVLGGIRGWNSFGK